MISHTLARLGQIQTREAVKCALTRSTASSPSGDGHELRLKRGIGFGLWHGVSLWYGLSGTILGVTCGCVIAEDTVIVNINKNATVSYITSHTDFGESFYSFSHHFFLLLTKNVRPSIHPSGPN